MKKGLLDRLGEFSGNELKIVFLIYRKTIGFNKSRDWIAAKQFRQIGIGWNQVAPTIDNLIKRGEITALDKNGNKLPGQKERQRKKVYYHLFTKELTDEEVKKLNCSLKREYILLSYAQSVHQKVNIQSLQYREKKKAQDFNNPSLTGKNLKNPPQPSAAAPPGCRRINMNGKEIE